MSLVKKLYIKQQKFVLDLGQFEILDQGITVLQGASGSGKSTILRCLLGLESNANVDWEFAGKQMSALKTPDRNIGVVFQSYDLFPHLTAKENIRFAAEARKLGHVETRSRLEMLLEKLDLRKCSDTKAQNLSGGERQRVALGRAIIAKPSILMLDEPFASLDQNLRKSARALLKTITTDEQIPALLVTHDAEDVRDLAMKSLVLESGKIKG
jgi:ABC-type sulfate/molybdate transport systems ATPase subunit